MPDMKLDLAHISSGLSSSQVIRKLEEEGYNELPTSSSKPWLKLIWEIFKDPTVSIIIACGVIYFIMGDPQEAFLLLFSLIVIMVITLVQERKAERALETLKQLSSPRALVIRDGLKVRIPGRDVVKEDILILQEGDRIPADAIILESAHIETDESLVTGESMSVSKQIGESIYAGTTIVKGQGIAQVTQTGLMTEMGKIGGALKKAKRVLSPLEIETRILVKKLNWLALALCLSVIAINCWYRGNLVQSFLIGLTLAMAILPNELPAVTTIFLALGAWRMSKKRVLTRHLPAIENLGAVTVLCVDKTGTLTLNKMTIQTLYAQGREIDFSAPLFSKLDPEFHEVIEYGILASRQDPFDPMEIAFHSAGEKFLVDNDHRHEDWIIYKEYPLSSELLSLSHAWKLEKQKGYIISAKGAPEAIIDLCHMDASESVKHHQKAQEMAKNGLRVLGIAKAYHEHSELPEHQHDFEFKFIGLVGISDPVRPEVPEAIQSCLRAGIRVVMITGDHPVTASSIAKKIGLSNPDKVLTGPDLTSLTQDELKKAIVTTSIFSRVKPEQKLLIVETLKACGEIVAMTGDGVNDAPALKSAHIGVAMGGRGTDVARESAGLVILDDDFGSIVEAVKMGRRVYQNLKNAMIYLSSVHIPIAGMSMLPVLFDLPLILLPAHIAFLHLVIEPASSIVFEVDPATPQIMDRPPRNLQDSILGKKMWFPIIVKGFSSFAALALIYLISLKRGQDENEARSLVFLTLMFSNMALILLTRNEHLSFMERFSFSKNKAAKWLLLSTATLIGIVFSLPATRVIFKFSVIHLIDICVSLVIGIVSVTWIQFIPSRKN